MADKGKRLPQNVSGDFFVDSTCIDCDACRQISPDVFRDHGGQTSVYNQPHTAEVVRTALMALITCPTGSIGTVERHDALPAVDAFPMNIAENVYFCGYTSESSFGAWSYLILRPQSEGGNVMVDSPRFTSPLVKKIAALGGVRRLFLTHKDDVADHNRFARKFDSTRIMHSDDGAGRLGVENIISGEEPVWLDQDLLAIPTSGHTRGHMVLLYRNRFLFTGDHLAWSEDRQTLTAFPSVAWYSWQEQIRSMEKLLDYRFEWVLPGHGRIHGDDAELMHQHLEQCVQWMRCHTRR